MDNSIKCPKCGSTQISANKKGFSGKKAAAGVVLTGGIGLLAGTIGSGKIIITCLSCGYSHKAGSSNRGGGNENQFELYKRIENGEESFVGVIALFLILSLVGSFISYKLFSNDWGLLGVVFTIATLICMAVTVLSVYWEATRSNKSDKVASDKSRSSNKTDKKLEIDNEIKRYIQDGAYLQATDYCRTVTGSTFEEANNYVNLIATKMLNEK